jgi:hypothetical protein
MELNLDFVLLVGVLAGMGTMETTVLNLTAGIHYVSWTLILLTLRCVIIAPLMGFARMGNAYASLDI